MAGNLIEQGLQVEIGGLLLGEKGGWELTPPLTGLGMPAFRTADTERPLDHGEWPEPSDFAGGRTVTGGLFTRSKDPEVLEARADALRAAFLPAQNAGLHDTPMALSMPGGAVRLLFGRPRRLEIDYDQVGVGILTATWQYKAHDPRLYGNVLHQATVSPPVSTGGRTYPRTYPMAYGGGPSPTVILTNAGYFETRPLWVLEGPLVNPRMENVTYGHTLKLALTIAAGDFVEIDFLERSVLLNGTASRYFAVTSDASGWWRLEPKDNEVRLGADSGAGSATVLWRDARL